MERLGYDKFVAQGGDWGASITQVMALQDPIRVLGIHSNMPGTVPAAILAQATAGAPPPPGLAGGKWRHSSFPRQFFRRRNCRSSQARAGGSLAG